MPKPGHTHASLAPGTRVLLALSGGDMAPHSSAPTPHDAVARTGAARDGIGPGVRLAIHTLYFGFAIAALLALCLLVPKQTSRAPIILLAGFGLMAVAGGARLFWNRRDPVELALQPAHLFIPVLVSAYTVFAFDASPAITAFSPSSPDSLPGLHIDQHVYFGLVLGALAMFGGWHGVQKGRLIETLLAVQIVLISVMYERSLANPTAVPPLVLTATALLLLRFVPIDEPTRPVDRSTLWLALPMTLFVAAALLSTAFSAYPAQSLATAGRMLALGVVAIVLCDAIRAERQRWLVWMAIVAPAVIEAALITLKLASIARAMGLDYALRNRIELAAGVETNPLGLSLTIGLLCIAGTMRLFPNTAARWAGAGAMALLLPALIVTYSVGSLLGLMGGLGALALIELSRATPEAPRRYARFAPAALLAAIGLIVVAVYVLPGPPRDALRTTVDDPTTGRSRVHLWEWALRDVRANPVLGVGPTVYWPRVRYVPDFPFRGVTKMLERRRLVGQDTTQWRFLFITHPHNLAIDVAEGMGVVGLAAFALLMAAAAWGALRVVRERSRPDRWLTGVGAALLVAIMMFAMGSIGVQVALLPLPAWIALGVVAMGHRRQGEELPLVPPAWLHPPTARALAAIASVAVLLVFVVRPVGSFAAASRAEARSAAGDLSGSASAWRVAARFDPLDIGLRAQLANIALRQGDANGALARAKEVDARAPRFGPALVQLGEISWLLGDTSAAERYFRDGVRNDGWQVLNADPYTPLGLLLLARGDVEGAKQAIADGLRVSPVNVRDRAWVRSGSELRLDRAYEASTSGAGGGALRAALERRMFLSSTTGEPGSIGLRDVLALLEREAQTRRAHDPKRAAEILDQAGLAYQFAGLHAEAARALADAVAADPGASYLRYDLAQSELALGDDAAASAQLQEVVRIAHASRTYDLRIGFAERDLALIAMRGRRYEEAARLMRSALDDYRWAYLPDAYPTLVEAYGKLGQPAEAAKWQRRLSFLQGR
jgi:O-antigen ligase